MKYEVELFKTYIHLPQPQVKPSLGVSELGNTKNKHAQATFTQPLFSILKN